MGRPYEDPLVQDSLTSIQGRSSILSKKITILKYCHVYEKKIYPVIISANLSEHEEKKLLKTLKKHRVSIGYTLDDLKGISPTLCQHKIKMEKDAKPVVDDQRRLNPKMKEVVRKEILKLLEAGLIYPVVLSQDPPPEKRYLNWDPNLIANIIEVVVTPSKSVFLSRISLIQITFMFL